MRALDRILKGRGGSQLLPLVSLIRGMFRNGEQGAWYDPSDLTTLFQDSAGITPVTAFEQPVGLMLDKRNTPYSVTFNGTSSHLRYADSSAFDLSSGDFTIEAWVNIASGTGLKAICSKLTASGYGGFIFAINATSLSYYLSSNGTAWNVASNALGGTLSIGTWNHVALVRNGNTFTPYLNGVAGTAITFSGTLFNPSNVIGVGADVPGAVSDYFNGSISNLRVVKGTAVYTGNFTPPAKQLTAIAGTSLLTCGNSYSGNTAVTVNGTFTSTGSTPFSALVGNHAFQSTSASRPVLSARYNLLTKTEQFDDAAWAKTGSTVAANATVAPDGTLTADKLVETTTNSFHYTQQLYTVSANTQYTLSFYAKAAERSWCCVFGMAKDVSYFNLANGSIGSAAAGTTINIQPAGNGWYLCTYVSSNAVGSSYGFGICTAVSDGLGSYVGDPTKGIYIWGADLRVSNDGVGLPAYQRVNTSTDYDTAGFPLYLKTDGVDDWMQTNSINFTSTDKMTVWAGVRKLSGSTLAALLELSSTTANVGTFGVYAPRFLSNIDSYGAISKGTSAVDFQASGSTYNSPNTSVLTFTTSIANPSAVLRINSSQAASDSTTQGTGNYGNYPLYLFRRGGTSLPFNGRMYGLIVRGAQSTGTQISNGEKYVNSKTKAF